MKKPAAIFMLIATSPDLIKCFCTYYKTILLFDSKSKRRRTLRYFQYPSYKKTVPIIQDRTNITASLNTTSLNVKRNKSWNFNFFDEANNATKFYNTTTSNIANNTNKKLVIDFSKKIKPIPSIQEQLVLKIDSKIDRNKPLTLSELENILQQNQLIFQQKQDRAKKRSDQVAFPQATIVSAKNIQNGAIAISSILGIIIAITVSPNAWLIGALIGAWYGQIITSSISSSSTNNYPLSSFIISSGKNLSQFVLQMYDSIQAFYFMYKTGQLSYNYYKRYQDLDERYHLTDKMDAWNLRFQQGKRNFDAWEKENEVGRKILAGLRTIVLLEEGSNKRSNNKRRRKVKRQLKRSALWIQRFVAALLKFITGSDRSELKNLFGSLDLEVVSQRIGAGITAYVAMNLFGLLFTSAPSALSLSCIGIGLLFPTWVRDVYWNVRESIENISKNSVKQKDVTHWKIQQIKKQNPLIDFHYFIRRDGTRRYYRTGKSIFHNDFSDFESKKPGWNWSFGSK